MRIESSKDNKLFRTKDGWKPLLGDLSERGVYWAGTAYLGEYWARL